MHAGELRHEFADPGRDVHESIGAGDLPAARPGAFGNSAGSAIGSSTSPGSCTPPAAPRPSTRFIGGSLKARATRIERGRWKTSAVGPYCNSSPLSSTAVWPPISSASVGSVVA